MQRIFEPHLRLSLWALKDGDRFKSSFKVMLHALGGGQLNYALSLPESAATREVSDLATKCMEHHLERRLKSIADFESPER